MKDKELILIDKVIESCSEAGFHYLSVDAIAKESGVSKATIYKYFDSKEQLFARSLEVHKDKALAYLESLYEDKNLSLDEKIDVRFDMVKKKITPRFNGCLFQLAYTEYCNQDDGITNACYDFKKKTQQLLSSMLSKNNISNAMEKAVMAEMIYNGLLASLQINKDDNLIDNAKSLYKKVIWEMHLLS